MILDSITLSSGHRVDYCEIGPVDAPVVVYCHGTPGSRFELLLAQPALQRTRADMRLIGLNRPGYGNSTFEPHRGFLPWADIVSEAADRLGIDRFAVLGASGGSPFALACAHALPDRVSRAGIIAGVASPDVPGMQGAAALEHEYSSTVIRSVRYGSLHLATRGGLTRLLTKRLIANLGPADNDALQEPRARAALERVVDEGFGQWGKAAALEAGLFMRAWDFDPAGIPLEVRLWHGGEDTRIPAAVSTAFSERIPNAKCAIWPHHGHFSWAMSDEIASVADFLTGSTRHG